MSALLLSLLAFYLGGSVAATLTMMVQDDVDWREHRSELITLFITWPYLLPCALSDAIDYRRRRSTGEGHE